MPLGDKKRQLDEQVAAAVRRAVEELQQEVRSRLQEATESLQRSIGDITPRLPESFLLEDDLRSMTDEAAAAARAETLALAQQNAGGAGRLECFTELKGAIAALDRASSQPEVLQALLDVTRPHASRTALFLLRGDRALGWGGRGFGSDEAIRALSFAADVAPWSDLAADGNVGTGMRELSAQESAAIASTLESELPTQAVLVALVLRDRVAAVVYADQVGDDALEIPALQILTYTAATALEALPLRTRRTTGTLAGGEIPAATAAISADALAAVRAPEPEPEPEPEPAPEAEPELVAASEPGIAAVDEEPELSSFVVDPEPAVEATPISFFTAPESEIPAEIPPLAAAETEAWPLPATDDIELETPELPATPSLDDEEAADGATPTWADSDTGFDIEPVALEAAPTMRYQAQDFALGGLEVPAAAEPTMEAGLPSLSGFSDFTEADQGALEIVEEPPLPSRPSLRWEEPGDESAAVEIAASVEPELEAIPELPPEPVTPSPALGANTVLVPTFTAPAPEPVPEPPTPAPASEPSATGPVVGSQVQPPADLEGPGWAFSTTSVPIAKGDEPSHEEARRLARLLVSEIQLYNQEEVEEGRRNRDLYERLKDDIDRSRQLYEERADPAIGKSTDYFYQELVRQLAAGDARALGI